MATKEQIAKLLADKPETIVARLNGTYIYPGAVSPMKQSPLCEEAAREIVRLRGLIRRMAHQRDYDPELNGDIDSILRLWKIIE